MQRKLVQQGNGALTCTLPSTWVMNHQLKKGEYVELRESGNELIMSLNSRTIHQAAELEVSQKMPFFKRHIKSYYILGYDKISIHSVEPLPYESIRESLITLIGYEIIEQQPTKCIVSMVLPGEQDSAVAIIRRTFFMISSMVGDIIIAFQNPVYPKNIDEWNAIATTEEAINKNCNLTLRMLNKFGYTSFHRTQYIYQFISSLEKIGDNLRDTCFAIQKKKPKKEVIIKYVEELKAYFDMIMHLFYKYDREKITELKEMRLALYISTRACLLHAPEVMMHLFSMLSELHQLEVALDPMNK